MPMTVMISIRMMRGRAVRKVTITIGSPVMAMAAIIDAACEHHDDHYEDSH